MNMIRYSCRAACVVSMLILLVSEATAATAQLSLRHSTRLGLVTFVTSADGGPIPVPAGRVQPQPMDFFDAHGAVFGVSDPASELIVAKVETDPLGWTHTSYQQVYQGVPAFSGILRVHQNPAGQIMSVNGRFYPISDKTNPQPDLSYDAALQIAAATLSVPAPTVERSELVIVDPAWYGDAPMGTHLAWYLILTDQAADLRQAFFVDAHSGEILDQWDMIHVALFRQVNDATGGLPGVLVKDEDGAPPVPPVGDIEVDHAFDYGGDTYGYYSRAFGRDGIDGNGSNIIQSVHRPNSCPNASWNGVYASYCNGVSSDDVIGHELTHGVTQFTANLIYQNQSGQLNESYSDVFGEMIDLFNGNAAFPGPPGGIPWPTPPPVGPGLDTPNNLRTTICSNRADGYPDGVRWLVGDDALGFSNAIRDMWNPPCSNDPDRANSPLQTCNANDAGGVHSGSGVPNHAFAMLTDGKTFNGYTVTGIGPIKSGAVWYRALSVYLTPASDFQDAYYSINQAAADLVGTTPNDPRTGLPSASAFTAADAVEVDEALLATEMNTMGACGASDDVLSETVPVQCADAATIFSDDFEGGVNGWTVSHSGPMVTPYDWVQNASLPYGRPGTAWFCDDPDLGNCSSVDETGLHSLFSPVINTPASLSGPTIAFTHHMAAEGSWDGGNLKVSVNSGPWTVVPRTAYTFNAYNGRLNGAGTTNTNPIGGELSFTGVGGRWGTTLIDLRGIVSGGQSVRFRFDFGKDGCTGYGGWYVDDFAFYDCPDCDGSNEPDITQFVYSAASDLLVPIGDGSPQSFTLTAPPAASGDVVLAFNARGDFSAASELLNITINGTPVGSVLATGGADCPTTPERAELVVPAATFNAAAAGGNADITMTATADVNAAINCNSTTTYVMVQVHYPIVATDCNINLQLDDCEATGAGISAFVNTVLSGGPYSCVYDFHPDGLLNGRDIDGFIDALLGP